MLELAKTDGSVVPAPEQQVLARMEAARDQLAQARTISEAKRVMDGAAAICEYLRRQSELGLEIVNDGKELQYQAEKRIGDFLKQPGAVKTERGRVISSQAVTISPPTYRELGLNREQARRCREVASVPAETIREMASDATAKGKELTREAVLKVAQKLKPVVIEAPGPPEPDAQPASAGIPSDLLNVVITGDARELAKRIPDNSVAVCLCDPVYENIEDYAWLAKECERILIPGGSVIAQVGTLRRFDAECAMRASGLQWVDLLAEVYPLAMCGLHHLRIQIGWKPHLWMSKGDRIDLDGLNLYAPHCQSKNSGWLMNRVHAKGKRSADASKDLHEWGDAEDFTLGLLERLCKPGDVVWDPYTGSGVVPVVAKRLGLPFIASEIRDDRAEKARQRLSGVRRDGVIRQAALDIDGLN
jgi:hypothetical protein